MKHEIKQFIIENNLLYPHYNRNIARKKYWDKRNKEWSDYIYQKYEEHNSMCIIPFSDFLRYFFFNEHIKYYYNTVEDFLSKTISLQHNPGTRLYDTFFEKGCNYVNFTPVSMTELIYCYRNNIVDRPKCKECINDVVFTTYNKGYRVFCSQSCQMKHNNKHKEIKKSDKSIPEIIEIVKSVPLDLRNLTKYEIADNFINILEHTKEFVDISVKERIYVFVNNLSVVDTLCTCGDKKIFASQGVGYKKTCGRINCINISKNENYFNDNEYNIRVCKGGGSFESGFLYIMRSDFNNFIKIGISQNPISRLLALRKSINDFRIIECFWLNKNLSKTEKELHKLYEHKKVFFDDVFDGHSEIFSLDCDDIRCIKDYIYDKIK